MELNARLDEGNMWVAEEEGFSVWTCAFLGGKLHVEVLDDFFVGGRTDIPEPRIMNRATNDHIAR